MPLHKDINHALSVILRNDKLKAGNFYRKNYNEVIKMLFLLYFPVLLVSFILGGVLWGLGAIFKTLFKIVFSLVAVAVLIVVCVLAAVFSIGVHMIGLIVCFFLFAIIGGVVVKAFRKE
mgnify:CR=1 FL=1